MSLKIQFIPHSEYERVRGAGLDRFERVALIAEMCRLNTLNAVKLAGSGHLGSSFSAMDIVAWLYEEELRGVREDVNAPDRDIYFSSKGHDVPGQYAVLHAVGILPLEKLQRLRRLGGLDGHPDVGTRGIEANSGSLGMGISKGRGMAWAQTRRGSDARTFVLTGDGELQEGQNYEGFQNARQHGLGNLTVIVDHNKLQTDRFVAEIIDLGDLEAKLAAFGWHVERCDGHDLRALAAALQRLDAVREPKILIADTVKGRGVSFMEHPTAMAEGRGLYRWHSGAPDDASFAAGHAEIAERINATFARLGLGTLQLVEAPQPEKTVTIATPHREFVAEAYGNALLDLAELYENIVVLDGDLAADCRVRGFEDRYPERFIENGIAEQDMVSMAGGLASQGFLPVVNSFASFLASRANEQIYNNATERRKIIYACHFGGLIPAGPGKSHQSIRDVSLFGALPDCTIIQPGNSAETVMALRYLVEEAPATCVLRLAIGPSPRRIDLPASYRLERGRGVVLRDGDDAAIFAYGPVMLHEALTASELLAERGFGLRVVNMPWLLQVDGEWAADIIGGIDTIAVLDDHAPVGGLADRITAVLVDEASLDGRRILRFSVEGFPACGTPPEVLQVHRLDGRSLARRILEAAEGRTASETIAVGTSAGYTAEAPQ